MRAKLLLSADVFGWSSDKCAREISRLGGFDGLMVTGNSQEGLLALLQHYKKILKNSHGYSIQLPLQAS